MTQDKGWIEQLRLKYGSELRRYLKRRVRDRTVSEDLEQDTYMRLQRLNEHDIRSPRALLFTVANHLAIDHLRQVQSEHSVLEPNDAMEEVPDSALAPPRVAELQQAFGLVNQAVNALPRRLREVWVMRHLEEMSYEQMSRALGITVDAVEQRLYRATLRLRRRLSHWGIDDVVRS